MMPKGRIISPAGGSMIPDLEAIGDAATGAPMTSGDGSAATPYTYLSTAPPQSVGRVTATGPRNFASDPTGVIYFAAGSNEAVVLFNNFLA